MYELLNVFDYERRAAELLQPGPLAYFAAGAGDEWTLRENVSAYRRWTLRPRLLRDVTSVTTARTVLGEALAAPIIVAPMAYQRHAHPEGEVAMSRAAASFGTIMTLSTMATASPAEVAAAAPDAPRWFQLYVFRDEGITRSIVQGAVESGYRAAGEIRHSHLRRAVLGRRNATAGRHGRRLRPRGPCGRLRTGAGHSCRARRTTRIARRNPDRNGQAHALDRGGSL